MTPLSTPDKLFKSPQRNETRVRCGLARFWPISPSLIYLKTGSFSNFRLLPAEIVTAPPVFH
jgi:hypothetical protein